MNIKVDTYSGYRADEYPKRFRIGEKVFEIIYIEDRWYSPGSSYFKVFADDGKTYILLQDLVNNRWEIVKGFKP